MESPGAFPDGEWDSLGKMFASEELDFTAQFLGQSPFFLEHDEALDPRASSNLFPTSEANVNFTGVTDSLIYSLGNLNSNLHYFSQESSNSSNCSSGIFSANTSHDNFFFGDSKHIPVANDIPMSMNICMMDEKNLGSFFAAFPDIALGEAICINSDMIPNGSGKSDDGQPAAIATPSTELVLKRKFDTPECPVIEEEKLTTQSAENTKKKPRVSRNVHKPKKNLKSKKNQKLSPNGEEESNAGPDGQSSCSYSSDEDNASQETNGGATSESRDSAALNLSGKTRASRGSATDPQSLYARKRRERINERLRILQNLVPNGTKVDISTMLEEAVHYVKFLQLQIKLLSSDDLWMYAPIAYNGMDIGLNQKIAPPL